MLSGGNRFYIYAYRVYTDLAMYAHVCIATCMYVCTCVYGYMYVCIQIAMSVNMYVYLSDRNRSAMDIASEPQSKVLPHDISTQRGSPTPPRPQGSLTS